MSILVDLIKWLFDLFPASWRRWLNLSLILCVGAYAVWGWVDGAKKDAEIASQKVEIVETRAAAEYFIHETHSAAEAKKLENAIKEGLQNEVSHGIKSDVLRIHAAIADFAGVHLALSQNGKGNSSSSDGEQKAAADAESGNSPIQKPESAGEGDEEVQGERRCAGTEFYRNALKDVATVAYGCAAYAKEHNIPLLE